MRLNRVAVQCPASSDLGGCEISVVNEAARAGEKGANLSHCATVIMSAVLFTIGVITLGHAQDRFQDSHNIVAEELAVVMQAISYQHSCLDALASGEDFREPCQAAGELYYNRILESNLSIYLDVLLERAELSGRVSDLDLGNEYMFRSGETRELSTKIYQTMTVAQRKATRKFK